MASFSGEATVKVDDKGRIILPASLRAPLEGPDGKIPTDKKPALIIVYGGEQQKQLQVYTEASIQEVRAKIERLPSSPRSRVLRYLYFSRTSRVEVDGAGRMLIEKKLREKLQIENELYVIGLGKTFELWRADVFEEQMARDMELAEGLAEGVDPLEELDRALAELDRSPQAGTAA
ncbi:division/cell wall cluster transcriptional repressor MraZ [Frigidibacter sp. ROC022]|uniref:division/cell wall cluster transcriptional repressor MraZ n=1 Tax=Frigidibacter sp. ROC022 TaxID=2971796 RepID=UPI00215B43F7|nr:cell division/cell wall cluster transcriptional repressor MraZ [Frigidibacter sp. ROC022]